MLWACHRPAAIVSLPIKVTIDNAAPTSLSNTDTALLTWHADSEGSYIVLVDDAAVARGKVDAAQSMTTPVLGSALIAGSNTVTVEVLAPHRVGRASVPLVLNGPAGSSSGGSSGSSSSTGSSGGGTFMGWTTLDLFAGLLGGTGNADDIGTDARFGGQTGDGFGPLAVDGAGNVFVVDNGAATFRRIDAVTGMVTHLGGAQGWPDPVPLGCSPFSNDDLAAATYYHPSGIAVNGAGTMAYVTDDACYQIHAIDLVANKITTLVFSPSAPAFGGYFGAIALDEVGNRLFVATGTNIFSVSLTGGVLAVTATALIDDSATPLDVGVSSTPAACSSAHLANANFPTWDAATKHLFVTEFYPSQIDLIDLSAGCNVSSYRSVDQVEQAVPSTLGSGPPLYAASYNALINGIDSVSSDTPTTYGQNGNGDELNGPINTLSLGSLSGLAMFGNFLYVADGSIFIRRLDLSKSLGDPTGVIAYAGQAYGGGYSQPNTPNGTDEVSAAGTSFSMPSDVVVDATGKVYVADNDNAVIKVYNPQNALFQVLPTSGASFNPISLAVAADGSVYATEGATNSGGTGNAIHKTISGATSKIPSGSGSGGYAEGGVGVAKFFNPNGITIYTGTAIGTWLNPGDLIVADSFNHVIRAVRADLSETVWLQGAQTPTSGYFEAPNGWAGGSPGPTALAAAGSNLAEFNDPQGLAVSGTTLFIADTLNNCIRKMQLDTGVVARLAGLCDDSAPGAADGTTTDARFNRPAQIRLDAAGNLFIADFGNFAVRVVLNAVAGTDMSVQTVVGALNGQVGAKIGPLPSRLNYVPSIALGNGGLYVLSEYGLLFAH